MANNMLDFIKANGFKQFDALPFTPVDNLIWSQMSYIDYEKAINAMPCGVSALHGKLDFGVKSKENELLFQLVASSARFAGTVVTDYVSEFSKEDTRQFAAVSFLLGDGTAYVSFRGTDSTIVGWKEDFMLSFTTPVPAQTEAVRYLNAAGRRLNCPLRVGGHSKGGNLAIYASAFCDKQVQDQIIEVYSNDGPGFEKKVLSSEGYLSIKPRIKRFIPESSVIGMLMDSDSSVSVIKSDGFSVWQHNPYSWLTEGEDFIYESSTTFGSDMISESQKDWFKQLDEGKRKEYVDLVFDLIFAGNPHTLKDMRTDPAKLMMTLKAIKNLPPEDRSTLSALIKQVFSSLYTGGSAALKLKETAMLELIKAKLPFDEKDTKSLP